MLFEELGFRYFGPVDGHDLPGLRKILRDLKTQKGPILLHVLHQQGARRPAGRGRPGDVPHAAGVRGGRPGLAASCRSRRAAAKAYTDAMSFALHEAMQDDPKVTVMTAAMCQGNKLEKVREDFPDRFFDVGICEIARRRVRRRAGQGRDEAGRGHLQHVPAAELRPDLPGGVPAEPARRVRDGPRRAHRSGGPDAPRRVRHPVHAAVPEHGQHGPGRRGRHAADAAVRARAQRPDLDALPEDEPRQRRSGQRRFRPSNSARPR